MKEINAYTDGACSYNPGPGGYGVILEYKGKLKEFSAGFKSTTNNRMELSAVIAALTALKEPCRVNLYSDSKYVVDAVNRGWANSWRSKGWKKADGKPALNIDLWEELLSLLEKHAVKFHWVKGHAGHSLNERCDEMATTRAKEFKEKNENGKS
ncbi:MAG: ribonuclease HI [Eubacteriales bacterium]